MNKYGKADAYRKSVMEGYQRMKAEMEKPKVPSPTCFCGRAAYLAVSAHGRHDVFCAAHEEEAFAMFEQR